MEDLITTVVVAVAVLLQMDGLITLETPVNLVVLVVVEQVENTTVETVTQELVHLKLLDRVSTILAVVEVVSVDTINLLEEVEADWWLLNIPLNIKLNYFLLWMYTKFFRHIFVSKNLN